MKRTSKNQKSWREEMTGRWDALCRHYQQASASPSFKRWMNVLLGVCKILFSVLAKKVVEHLFEDF